VQREWPGNVRELLNVLQRAFVFSDGRVILPVHIVAEDDQSHEPEAAGGFGEAKKRTIAAFERVYVQDLLRKHNGNITHAAKEAKKDRRAFSRLVSKLGIDRLTMQTR
jgi:DNA-binding NtrC family response regulator